MGMRKHIAALALIAASLGAPAQGADTPDDPLNFFANCTGRLSAELSHRWMLAETDTSEIEGIRAAFIDILATITPEGAGRDVLNLRIQARTAHSALLSRALFGRDDWASDRAAGEIARCAAFVVGPTVPATDDSGVSDTIPVSAPIP